MKRTYDGGVVIAVAVLSIAIGMTVGSIMSYDEAYKDGQRQAAEVIRLDAIQTGHAQYDINTGAWRWKTPTETMEGFLRDKKLAPPIEASATEDDLFPLPTKRLEL